MSDGLHLSPDHRGVLEALIREHLPDVEVWAYGSRVNGRCHAGSDLDVVVRGPGLKKIPPHQLADFADAVCESTIPFLVEARDWARLPKPFRREIERQHVVLRDVGNDLRRIPHWPEAAFASLLSEPIRNGVYKPKEFHGQGAKMVNMGELFAHPRLADVPMKRVELDEAEKHRFSVRGGDLLFARRSLVAEGAGKCCVVLESPESTAFESSIIRARPDPGKADPLFLYYYFNSPAGLHGLDTIRRQVAVAGITGTDLANLNLKVPPLPEQCAIAHILGTLDDTIELNRRMNETLEATARALFKSWFVDFEPVRAQVAGRATGLPKSISPLCPSEMFRVEARDVPVGWCTGTLADVAIARRHNVTPADCGDQTPYIGLEHMPRRSIALGAWGSAGSVKSAKSRFERGDILFGKLRPYFHKVGIAPVDGVCSTDIVVIAPKSPEWSAFVSATASSDGFVTYTDQTSTGTRMPWTSWKAMSQYAICVPPRELASAYQEAVQPALDHIVANIHSNVTLASLRDALLPKLISGELCAAQAERAVEAVTGTADA